MPYYRMYLMDVGGHITDVHEAVLTDDDAARGEASRLDHWPLVEIWRQQTKIGEVRQRPHQRGD